VLPLGSPELDGFGAHRIGGGWCAGRNPGERAVNVRQ
jgi:hypothetical protein